MKKTVIKKRKLILPPSRDLSRWNMEKLSLRYSQGKFGKKNSVKGEFPLTGCDLTYSSGRTRQPGGQVGKKDGLGADLT